MHACGPLRVPSGAVRTHPLQPHGLPCQLGDVGSVHRRIPGIVASVGSRPHDPDAAHLLLRKAQQLRHAIPCRVRLLRAGPDRGLPVPHFCDSARGSHAGMRLQRPLVLRLNDSGGGFECSVDIALPGGLLAFDDRRIANVLMQAVGAGEGIRRRRCPLHFQRARRLDCVPFTLGNYREEFSLPHQAGIPDGVGIDTPEGASRDRRTNHAGVQHSRDPDVGDVIRGTENLSGHIATRNGGADQLVLAQRLRLRLALHIHEVADRLVPVDPRVEGLAAHQLGVGDTLYGRPRRRDNSVGNRQLRSRYTQNARRSLEQYPPCLGRGITQRLCAQRDTRAS